MYENLGNKIKLLAVIPCVIGIVAYIIAGLIMLCIGQIGLGFLFMILGPILCWISSLLVYGIGELIDISESTKHYAYENNKLLTKIAFREGKYTINSKPGTISKEQNISTTGITSEIQKTTHKWLCNGCRNLIETSPCPYCGNE